MMRAHQQRFLFASDSFKGSLSSRRTAELLCEATCKHFPDAQTSMLEVADGGEGTAAAVVNATGGTMRTVRVVGPIGQSVDASYGILPDGKAIIEMAAASGLPLVPPSLRDPLHASTYGTGQLIADALELGVTEIALAIGGSATNDGGMGCMRALGVRFLDESGTELAGIGADLIRVHAIDASALDQRIGKTCISVMCDVDNPLVGPHGATCVFGPQKGADPQMVSILERGMRSYANVLTRAFPHFDPSEPGMGAAGGLGAAARAFLGAEALPGVECVLDLVHFDKLLQNCTLCVTGEGHADGQSSHGKVISGIAKRCKAAHVPCVAVVGGMDPAAQELLGLGVDAIVPTIVDVGTIDDALENAERNYRMAADRLFSLLKLGHSLPD
jgi:glycerate kinase